VSFIVFCHQTHNIQDMVCKSEKFSKLAKHLPEKIAEERNNAMTQLMEKFSRERNDKIIQTSKILAAERDATAKTISRLMEKLKLKKCLIYKLNLLLI